jgi:hypothetical protein
MAALQLRQHQDFLSSRVSLILFSTYVTAKLSRQWLIRF